MRIGTLNRMSTTALLGQVFQHAIDLLRDFDLQEAQLFCLPVSIGITPCSPGNDDIASPIFPSLR